MMEEVCEGWRYQFWQICTRSVDGEEYGDAGLGVDFIILLQDTVGLWEKKIDFVIIMCVEEVCGVQYR
jgi:hypothetical protein